MSVTNRLYSTKNDFPTLLKDSLGLVTRACEKAGISRVTYYDWRNNDPVFAAECDEAQMHTHDFVESKLFKLINDGNPAAIIFYCKTKLKHRGYTENLQIVQIVDNNAAKDIITEKEREILDRYVEDRMKYIETKPN